MSTKAKNFLRRMKQRLVIIFGIALLFFVVLIGRVIYISLAKGQEYQEEVLDQKTYDSLDIPFERGDIVLVGFDPASGHEQQGAGRPALVLSVQAFNQLGMTLVAPITQGGNFARYAGFSVPLHCEEGDVHGVVLVNQVRMMDLRARLAKRIGLAADEVVEEALLRLQAVVE